MFFQLEPSIAAMKNLFSKIRGRMDAHLPSGNGLIHHATIGRPDSLPL